MTQAICNRQHFPICQTIPLFRFRQLAAKVRDGMVPLAIYMQQHTTNHYFRCVYVHLQHQLCVRQINQCQTRGGTHQLFDMLKRPLLYVHPLPTYIQMSQPRQWSHGLG